MCCPEAWCSIAQQRSCHLLGKCPVILLQREGEGAAPGSTVRTQLDAALSSLTGPSGQHSISRSTFSVYHHLPFMLASTWEGVFEGGGGGHGEADHEV